MFLRSLAIAISTVFCIASAPAFAQEDTGYPGSSGAVYTATNDPNGNQVVVFSRGGNGALRKVGVVSTGGKGSGGQLDPLGSQGSLQLTPDHRWLLAVNAGSNEISVFKVGPQGIQLTQKISSEGQMPVSLAIHRDLVYVLNAGTSPNIAGFRLAGSGRLSPLQGSVRTFGGVNAGALAQVGFGAGGRSLVITDKPDHSLITFQVGHSGLPSRDSVTSSATGMVPFAFATDSRGRVLVVNAGSGTVVSYAMQRDGKVQAVSSSASNRQKASCWIERTDRGFVYTSNTASGTLSFFFTNETTGAVSLVESVAGKAKSPIDMGLVENRFLYVLDPMAGGVDAFKIGADGKLSPLGTTHAGLAIFAQGLAAH